ncbi:hypothetical protein ACRALDRAFT_2019386 [Sodiomyces alcalophilus JCM 7366]|uniref:uncharacterized protein n=1 Tax=Sodiomyces alcalophilus JCM 7366 TaxID=591952 RepID=UPI0039B5E71F
MALYLYYLYSICYPLRLFLCLILTGSDITGQKNRISSNCHPPSLVYPSPAHGIYECKLIVKYEMISFSLLLWPPQPSLTDPIINRAYHGSRNRAVVGLNERVRWQPWSQPTLSFSNTSPVVARVNVVGVSPRRIENASTPELQHANAIPPKILVQTPS